MDDLDQKICLCFHVTRRKVINFLRVEKPKRPAQLSECFGAGTGCGWCRPYLEKLFQAAASEGKLVAEIPDAGEYAHLRSSYVREGHGTPPPGATPVEDSTEPPVHN